MARKTPVLNISALLSVEPEVENEVNDEESDECHDCRGCCAKLVKTGHESIVWRVWALTFLGAIEQVMLGFGPVPRGMAIADYRPAASDLTTTETRLAALAAEGLSNKEIAAALHISVHTVEAHLTRIYRKLGIHSRAALARRLNSSQVLSEPAESSASARPAWSESRDRAGSTRAVAR